jgi:hypothetical protein
MIDHFYIINGMRKLLFFFSSFDSKVLVIYHFHLNDKSIKEAFFYSEGGVDYFIAAFIL